MAGPDRRAAVRQASPQHARSTRRAPTTRSSTRFYADPWFQGHAAFADGARRPLRGHRPRALAREDQAQPARQDQAQDQEQEEDRAGGHALGPEPQLRAPAPTAARGVPKEKLKPGESRTTVKLGGTIVGRSPRRVAGARSAAGADLGAPTSASSRRAGRSCDRVRRPRPVLVQARLLHAARLRELRRRDVQRPARGGSATSTSPSAGHLRRVRRQARRGRRALDHDVDPTASAVRYRTRWYRSGGYSPVFWGTSRPVLDDTDYRWYDDGPRNDDDDDGGGFGDS